MKTKIVSLFLSVFIFGCLSGARAQYRMKFFELHYEFAGNPSVVVSNNLESTTQNGFGANINVGKEYVDFVMEYNYRRISMKKFNIPELSELRVQELYFGFRYYPMKPTFLLGNMAVRFTAGVVGGFDFEPNWRTLLFAGMAFSPVRNTSGLSINFVYRPGKYPAARYNTDPSWALRLGLMIGPHS